MLLFFFRKGRVNIKQDETTKREQRDKPDYYLVSNSWPWERVQPTHSSLSWDLSQASAQREAALAWRLPMKQESQGRLLASPAMQQVGGIVDQGGCQSVLGRDREQTPPTPFPSGCRGTSQAFWGMPATELRQLAHQPQARVAPTPPNFACQDNQAAPCGMDQFWVCILLILLRLSDGLL